MATERTDEDAGIKRGREAGRRGVATPIPARRSPT